MKRRIFLAALFFCLAASSAWAIDVENFQPAIGTQNLLTLYTSTTYAQGQFGFSLMSDYASNPMILNYSNTTEQGEETIELKVVERLIHTELQGAVGLFKFWEIGVAASAVTTEGKDMDTVHATLEAFPETKMEMDTGAGDMRAYMKLRILENKSGSIGLAIVPTAGFPTGREDMYAGAGAVNAGGRLVIDKRFERVNIVLNGGYMYMGDADGPDEGFDPTGRAEFGAGVTVMAHKNIELLAEINGRTVDYGVDQIDAGVPTEALGAMKVFAGPVHFTFGGGAGVNSGIGNPSFRGFAGVALTVPRQNRELAKPQPVAPPPPSAESPTDDSDKDGLTNYDETHTYKTDPYNPDTDGDGLKDGEEVKKFKTDPTKDDTDGDGLSDFEEIKVYFTNPLKTDTDGDTLSDGVEVKQYRTNPTEKDTDRDGVNDNLDGAPLEPETVNGILDEDGIPEVILAKKPSGVTLTDSIIWLPEKLRFTSTKNDTLDKPSLMLIKDVAALMNEYPNIKIEVQGHTASNADKALAQSISTTQSRAVTQALIQNKVKAERVTFKGYGADFPIASNNTPEGRVKNQRIDFVIIEK